MEQQKTFPGFASGWKRVAAGTIDGLLSLLIIPIFINIYRYFAKGQTLGKVCMHCTVVDVDGNKPKTGALLSREVIELLITMIPFGFLMYIMLWTDEHHQGLHDKAAKTFVVKTKDIRPVWVWVTNIFGPILLIALSFAAPFLLTMWQLRGIIEDPTKTINSLPITVTVDGEDVTTEAKEKLTEVAKAIKAEVESPEESTPEDIENIITDLFEAELRAPEDTAPRRRRAPDAE